VVTTAVSATVEASGSHVDGVCGLCEYHTPACTVQHNVVSKTEHTFAVERY
jgi:hypothetical protein